MKTARTLITICLLFTATASLFAQTTPTWRLIKVDIPFAFGVEDRLLPAGKYTIFTVTPERSIRIVSANGKHSAIVNTLPNYAKEPSSNSRLVFHRYGNEYFLAEVWTAGQDVARNPLSSKKAMESASNGERPEAFTVIALADSR
jgi:hypothetical protein